MAKAAPIYIKMTVEGGTPKVPLFYFKNKEPQDLTIDYFDNKILGSNEGRFRPSFP